MVEQNQYTPQRSLSKGMKFLVVVLILFGASAIGYGGYQIGQNIFGPFRSTTLSSDDILSRLVPRSQEEEDAALKAKDTDSDSLSDYDEINIYNTSPYLADSDSDGVSDDKEVKLGEDPNCPKGQDCRSIHLVTPDTKISDLFPEFSDSDITLKDKTLAEFKKILIDNGFSQATLDKTDDQTLLVILEEVLKFQDEQSNATSSPTSTPTTGPQNLDDVRAFLIELGVPKEEVYSLSNQEVEAILKTLQ